MPMDWVLLVSCVFAAASTIYAVRVAGGVRAYWRALAQIARALADVAAEAGRMWLPSAPRRREPDYLLIAALEVELDLWPTGVTCWRCGRVNQITSLTHYARCAFCDHELGLGSGWTSAGRWQEDTSADPTSLFFGPCFRVPQPRSRPPLLLPTGNELPAREWHNLTGKETLF